MKNKKVGITALPTRNRVVKKFPLIYACYDLRLR